MNDRKDLFGTPIIDHFRNDYDFLSNFYVGAPFTLWGVNFITSEHAYVWAKTLVPEEKEAVLACGTPGQVKRLGKEVTLREDWEVVRFGIMVEILEAKFGQNWGLRQKLEETGDAIIIENNSWHDNIWGSCTCEKCGDKGLNYLGIALTQVRTKFRNSPLKNL